MRRSFVLTGIFVLAVMSILVGCKKSSPAVRPGLPPPKPATTAPSTDAPASTVSLSASPTTIERGGQTTLTWESDNATSVVIDAGVGNVGLSGSIVVSPDESVTYTATARGAGGDSRASARVTVLAPRDSSSGVTSTDIDQLQAAIASGQVRPVFFAYDEADLTAESKDILAANARIFRMYPSAKVVVEGHCDERGSEEYNLALGDRRALAARDYLIQLGVEAERLDAISFGEERPFATGQDEASYALNRRAHFAVRR